MSLTELVIKRPSLVVVIFTVLAFLGYQSYQTLNYELLPKITPPVLTITTVYPGASPSEIENTVSKKIEDVISTLEKISSIRTNSSEGISFVVVEFSQSADIDKSLQEAQRRLNALIPSLPKDCKAPMVSKFALDELPILRMGVTSNLPGPEFADQLKNQIIPRISQVAGVGQVITIGAEEREIKINLSSDKLKAYNLSLLQITQAIQSSNMDFPTGNIKDKDGQFVVRLAGKFSTLEQIKNLVVGKSRTGGDILLKDIAEVEDGTKELKQINRINGKTSVGILVQKQTDANAVNVSQLVKTELQKLEKDYEKIQLKFDIALDGSEYTLEAANAVKHDLWVAIFLVAAVMLLFLHSLVNSLIVMVAIPASLVCTFIAMYLLGYSLNLMTLLGLSLVIGILVDDSIVVLENIYRHLEMGKKPKIAALIGRNEIGFTAISITLVDVVVFLPLGLTSGIIGNIMREFSMVVVVSTLASLFVSFTITPVLASRFSKLEHINPKTPLGFIGYWFEKAYHYLTHDYLSLLKWSLNHKLIVLSTAAILFFGSFALVGLGFIGGEFMTPADRGEFSVSLELPTRAKLEEINLVSQKLERALMKFPQIEKVQATVGASTDGFVSKSSNNISEISIKLVPREERKENTEEMMKKVREIANAIPGIKARVSPIGIFGGANQTPIQLVVKGDQYEQVYEAANLIAQVTSKIPGTADVRLSAELGKPELRVELDREKMATFGLNIAEVGMALRTALTGNDDTKFRVGTDEYDIRIVLDKVDRNQTQQLGDMIFVNRMGKPIYLKQFAEIRSGVGPSKLERKDRSPAIVVLSQVNGRPSGTVGAEIKNEINQLYATGKLSPSIKVFYEGDLKNQSEANSSLSTAFLVGFLFTYLIMVALYDSYIYPFVVLFSIPLAIIGALLALAMTMNNLNVFSILGIIMLMGLVAKNAILLVDFTNDARSRGSNLYDAVMEAGKQRLRPILMTTLSMVIGMLPIAIAAGAGSEWKAGLAWALIGGLSSSMFLTLVVVPVVYIVVTRIVEKIQKLLGMKVSTIKSIDEEDEFTLELQEYEAQQKLFKQNNGKHQKDNQPIILN
jgi:HAE1 family hydrophobic/amphiphilic exporter-1